MTWSYSHDPATSDKDAVRFLVGDTDSSEQLVSDEEILFALQEEPNVRRAAAFIARALGAKFSREADKSVGDLRIAYSQRARGFYELADRLDSDASRRTNVLRARPYAGGISVSDKEAVEDNSDRVRPSFAKGMHDYLHHNDYRRKDDCE
ncbi:MAG TPA: hypothetical protein ENK57_21790 [Polyangiaceae bacterium]|nr:hypothetical protein [Polyangiaceae bacterium]